MIKYPANFRDLGGVKTKDGKLVKKGLLFRSGEPDELTDREMLELKDNYDIRLIVDFRTAEEAERSAKAERANIHREIIDILKNAGEYVTEYNNFRKIKDPDRVHSFMNEVYALMITDENSAEGYRRFLRLIKELTEGAALFHCFAGKDRTGVAAAILLTILGVSKEDIFKDYLLTNKMRAEANKKLLENDIKSGVSKEHLSVTEKFLLVDERYLNSAYAAAERAYGSFDEYITEALGADEETRRVLKERYLT